MQTEKIKDNVIEKNQWTNVINKLVISDKDLDKSISCSDE